MDKYSIKLSIAKDKFYQHQKDHQVKRDEINSRKLEFFEVEEIRKFAMGNSKSLFDSAKTEYFTALQKYRLAYDKLLHKAKAPPISLSKSANRKILEEALHFWEGKRLKSHAWCIMSNHFHWVLTVFETNEKNEVVYLQDILHSVKQFTAKKINIAENTSGQFWARESFETTIKNNEHFDKVVNYVINNPVSAGLVTDWKEWPGTWVKDNEFIE